MERARRSRRRRGARRPPRGGGGTPARAPARSPGSRVRARPVRPDGEGPSRRRSIPTRPSPTPPRSHARGPRPELLLSTARARSTAPTSSSCTRCASRRGGCAPRSRCTRPASRRSATGSCWRWSRRPADALSEARDLDVQIDYLTGYREHAPAADRAGHRQPDRAAARAAAPTADAHLAPALARLDDGGLRGPGRARWWSPAIVKAATRRTGSTRPAAVPRERGAHRRARGWTSCTRSTRRSATRRTSTELHDMRIAAKRLRYVLEIVGFAFGPPGEAARRRRPPGCRRCSARCTTATCCPARRAPRRQAARHRPRPSARVPVGEPAALATSPNRTRYRGLQGLVAFYAGTAPAALRGVRRALGQALASQFRERVETALSAPASARPR